MRGRSYKAAVTDGGYPFTISVFGNKRNQPPREFALLPHFIRMRLLFTICELLFINNVRITQTYLE